MKILITGGSGFLGINLTRYLLARGHVITVFDRLPFDYPDCRDRISFISGDIRNYDEIKQAMTGHQAVVHAAAALPLCPSGEIVATDVGGTENVLRAAWEARAERVSYISSTAVYGIPKHVPIYEDDDLVGVGPYGSAKIAAERICANFRSRGMVVPVLRPKTFIGPERLGIFSLLFDWAQTGHGFPVLGAGSNQYQLLDVEDLCEAIDLSLSGDKPAVNDVFNIGAECFRTMAQDFQAVLDFAGYNKRITQLPAWPAVLALRCLNALGLSPIYPWVFETAAKNSIVSITKAKTVLGFKPKFSNQESLLRNFSWYIENSRQFKASFGKTHRTEWKQGIIGLAKYFF